MAGCDRGPRANMLRTLNSQIYRSGMCPPSPSTQVCDRMPKANMLRGMLSYLQGIYRSDMPSPLPRHAGVRPHAQGRHAVRHAVLPARGGLPVDTGSGQ